MIFTRTMIGLMVLAWTGQAMAAGGSGDAESLALTSAKQEPITWQVLMGRTPESYQRTGRVLGQVDVRFDELPPPICMSIDSTVYTVHDPEGCSASSFAKASELDLVRMLPNGQYDNGAAFIVEPGYENFRSEGALNPTPLNATKDLQTTYVVSVAFPEGIPQGDTPIFFQVKECGGALKAELNNGCSKPAFSLKVDEKGVVTATINRLIRIDGVVAEKKTQYPLVVLDSSTFKTRERLHFTVEFNRLPEERSIKVWLQERPLFSHEGPYGAPDSTSEYVKFGAYAAARKQLKGGVGKIFVEIDDIFVDRRNLGIR